MAKAGYTLVETVLVATIVLTISTISYSAYQNGRADAEVKAAALEVLSTIREVQQHALSGTIAGAPAYGVRFYNSFLDNTKLSSPVYVDTNDNNVYDEGVDQLLVTPSPTHDSRLVYRTYCVAAPYQWIDITFKPSYPTVSAMTSGSGGTACPFQRTCVKVSKGNYSWWVYTDTRTGMAELVKNSATANCQSW
jgi:type II secretory pathway pseudopilin PulG